MKARVRVHAVLARQLAREGGLVEAVDEPSGNLMQDFTRVVGPLQARQRQIRSGALHWRYTRVRMP
jgi:hypothetical protein